MFTTRRQSDIIAALREEVAGLRGQLAGRDDGRTEAVAQLARHNSTLTRERDDALRRARGAERHVVTALRLVAAHLLDLPGQPAVETATGLLVDEFAAAGLPLRGAMAQLRAERADSSARVSAAEAVAAVATAPTP